MKCAKDRGFSRREQEIMEIIYRRGQATAEEVLAGLADPPSYSSVRALLTILETKGHLRHTKVGKKYNYLPTKPCEQAAEHAISKLVKTFFAGSAEKAVAALLDSCDVPLTDEQLQRMEELIRRARKEGR